MRLLETDIGTPEVLTWQGVHLLHAPGSSCSQKVRIVMNLKGISWESHPIDLKSEQNHEPWFLGINPRGLVPVLVHDGVVHIESNDILAYLEQMFPDPALIPRTYGKRVSELLRMEDKFHRDLRTLTFRYVLPARPGEMKSQRALQNLRRHRGTVNGERDVQAEKEAQFWEAANQLGMSDEQVRLSALRFNAKLTEFDESLGQSDYLIGHQLTVLDVAWYVYAKRLIAAGYPLHQLHGRVSQWFARLDKRCEFHDEVAMPEQLRQASLRIQQTEHAKGTSLQALAGLS